MKFAYLTLLLPLLFYGLIPFLGGLLSSRRWRIFRKRILAAVQLPDRTFFGRRDGVSKHRGIWFRAANRTALLDFSCPLSIYQYTTGNTVVKPLRNEDLSDFPEGSDFLLIGQPHTREGYITFIGSKDNPLILVVTDSGRNETLRGLLSHGFPGNLYWNFLTPWSLLAGFLSCLIMINIVLMSPDLKFLFKLVLSETLFPLLLFIPPGGFLTFLALFLHGYQNRIRSESEYLKVSALLKGKAPDGNTFKRAKRLRVYYWIMTGLSGFLYPLGLAVNTGLMIYLLGKFLSL
jgi:hypothetical protein